VTSLENASDNKDQHDQHLSEVWSRWNVSAHLDAEANRVLLELDHLHDISSIA